VLSKSTVTGIGSSPHESIVIKHLYNHQPDQLAEVPFKCWEVKEESEKIFREANILYWSKALFKLMDNFITKRLVRADEPPVRNLIFLILIFIF